MQLTKEAIEEFKELYFQEYGRKISDKEALEKGIRLLKLFQVIYRPIDKRWPKIDS